MGKEGNLKSQLCCDCYNSNINIFNHCVYEYRKGLRDLALCTVCACRKEVIEGILKKKDIAYYIQEVDNYKINIFFGDDICIDIVNRMLKERSLSDLTDEEDFILGIMLGYNRLQQCERYIKRKLRVDAIKVHREDDNIFCVVS